MPPHPVTSPEALKTESRDTGLGPSTSPRSGLPAFACPQGSRSRLGKDTARHRKSAGRTRLSGYTQSITELRGTVPRRHLDPFTATPTHRTHPLREAPSRLTTPSFSLRLRWKCQGRGRRAPLTPWNAGAGRRPPPHASSKVPRSGQ